MRDSEHANEIRPAKIATTKGFKWSITGQRVLDEAEVIFPSEQHAKMFCDTYNTGVAQYRRTFGGDTDEEECFNCRKRHAGIGILSNCVFDDEEGD